MNYIGVDIGGTQVKIGIIDEKGTVGKSSAYDVAFDGYDTPIIETVVTKLTQFMRENGLKEDQIHGIGVSATGQIDVKEGKVVGAAGHIKNWEGCCIKEHMKKIYSGPVSVMNDANCAALAEQWIGGAKGASDAVIITIGTGVGGGIIVNSEILCGAAGGAGEIGHLTIRNNGTMCSCGNRGCYEQYASTTALVKTVKKAQKAGKLNSALLNSGVITGRTIFEAAGKDSYLDQILDKWIDYIADGLVGIIHTFNPQVVLVGGGVSAQKELFIDPLRAKVVSRVMPGYSKILKLDAAKLGNDAGMVGAVYYCMKHGD
ncbi:MAG TPA: ROK family protein [Mobilitalea sp.]|nr:ROK family protein [Mobilitalea sp.]